MADIFEEINSQALQEGINPRTNASREWFRKKLRQIRLDPQELMESEKLTRTNNALAGSMVLFFYDPKTKKKLPYYDRFPLTIIIDKAPKGFYGLNLHYLPVTLRARFLDKLLDNLNNDKFNKTTRFALTYEFLQNSNEMRYYKPCFKRYLTRHVRGNFARVEANEWEIATFLPVADFAKQSETRVHRDSRKKING